LLFFKVLKIFFLRPNDYGEKQVLYRVGGGGGGTGGSFLYSGEKNCPNDQPLKIPASFKLFWEFHARANPQYSRNSYIYKVSFYTAHKKNLNSNSSGLKERRQGKSLFFLKG
jgi:hypothetical protein